MTFKENVEAILECNLPNIKEDVLKTITHNICELTPSGNWISVKDKLPEESGYYLVCGKNTIWISEFLILCNMIGGWCGKPDKPIVEAWMPLPKPYNKGE